MTPNAPASGCTTTISASAQPITSATPAQITYATMVAGPAWEIARLEPRKSPVPMAPPSPIMVSWRPVSRRRSPVSLSTEESTEDLSGG